MYSESELSLGASTLGEPGSDTALEDHASNSSPNASPGPFILDLLQGRPDAVLVLLEVLDLVLISGVLVALLLRSLGLLASKIAEEEEVHGRAEKDNRVRDARSEKEEGERGMNQGVTQVAITC